MTKYLQNNVVLMYIPLFTLYPGSNIILYYTTTAFSICFLNIRHYLSIYIEGYLGQLEK